ncbi:MAG: GTPase [Ktedonobacterales bacterium]
MAKHDGSESASRKRKGLRARDFLTVSNLAKLPSNLSTVRKFIHAVNWKDAQQEVESELHHKIALLGLANSGKSTLFNTLRGKYASEVSPEAGTTKTNVKGTFGPFTLIDTPGHLPDLQSQAVAEAAAVVYLLDASQGIRAQDAALIGKLRLDERPLIVALNKSDLLKQGADEAASEAAARLHVRDVIPISARSGENVAEELIPAIIETSPDAALALGRSLPQYRRKAALKLVRTAALVSLAAGMEPLPLIDIPVLLGNQIRLVMRVAALYNEPLAGKPTRELFATVGTGLLLRYVAEEAAKAVPFGGDLVSGVIAAAGTWALGQVAIEYFESGKKLTASELRHNFTQLYRRYREDFGAGKSAGENAQRAEVVIREERMQPVGE